MAEAFSEEIQYPDRNTISVLLLATRWQFDTYGLSTINKSLVNNLRLVDPERKTIKITCVVVEEEGKISQMDISDAQKSGAILRGAKRPMSKKRVKKPKMKWLDKNTGTYYRHFHDHDYDLIIGHAPYLANGCFNLREIYKGKGELSKIILMFHGLPKDEDGNVDETMLLDWLKEADIVFSVGKPVESEIVSYLDEIDEQNRPILRMYIPSYPLEFFHIVKEPKEKEVEGTQNITMMSAEPQDLVVTGLDFDLAINATIGAAEHIRDFHGLRTNLTMLAAQEDDKIKWKAESDKLFQSKPTEHIGLSFKTEAPWEINKLLPLMKRSILFLFPLKADSPIFGTEALTAIAAEVPVLISKYSGLARFLFEITGDESVVYETKAEPSVSMWKDKILERLLRPEQSQRVAKRLREQLLLNTTIAGGHLEFINVIAKKSCVQLRMEIQWDSDTKVSHQNLDMAIKFGVEKVDVSDVNKYVVSFLRKLLLQREKLDKELLVNYLNPKIEQLWQEVLSSLKEENRKLINIDSGSLVLTLFCPSRSSQLQLQEENWKDEIQRKMTDLLWMMGTKVTVKFRTEQTEPVEIHHPRDAPLSSQLTQKEKLKIDDSEKVSTGYETMTTLSEFDPELRESGIKVESWLSTLEGPSTAAIGMKTLLIQHVATCILYHVPSDGGGVHRANRFTVSDSGTIGISCFESPSLSLMYPKLDQPPMVLSDDKVYRSATFVKISGKEYLAAASNEDGCLFLWDIDLRTCKKVFDPKLPQDKFFKEMNICEIDGNTVGYGEVCPLVDGSKRVFILKTDKDQWILSSILRLFISGNILDMHCTKAEGGADQLLLCVMNDCRIMAMEMGSGKTRWGLGKQWMGREFEPTSICTDNDNTIFVADWGQNKIHLLSATDGSLIKWFDVDSYYDINDIFFVRFYDKHLYIERKILTPKEQKYAILKFRLIEEM